MTAYEILRIPTTATQEEIQQVYRELQRELHPDFHQNRDVDSARLHAINSAYYHIRDEIDRYEYDWEMSIIARNRVNYMRLIQLRNRRADTQMNAMESEFDYIRKNELQKTFDHNNGIIILDARYGDADYIFNIWAAMRHSGHEHNNVLYPDGIPVTAYRDVTASVQCLVRSGSNGMSMLTIESDVSKTDIRGFAEPLPNESYRYTSYNAESASQMALWILYKSGDRLCQIAVDDTEPLTIPDPEHRLFYVDTAMEQWNAIKHSKTLAEVQAATFRKRTRSVLALITVTTLAFLAYRKYQSKYYPQEYQNTSIIPSSIASLFGNSSSSRKTNISAASTTTTQSSSSTSSSSASNKSSNNSAVR
jgi:hypothetical protein